MNEEGEVVQATSMDHEDMTRALRRYFMDELSPRESTSLREHIRGCQTCLREYERWASAERALFGEKDDLTPLMLDRIREAVVPAPRSEAPLAAAHRPWIFALATAAVLLVAVRVFVPDGGESEAFIPRGAPSAVSSTLVVRVVAARLLVDGAAPKVFDLASGHEALRPGDHLQIRLSHDHAGFARAFLLQAGRTTPLTEVEHLPSPGEEIALEARIVVDERFTDGPGELLVVVADRKEGLELPAGTGLGDEPGRFTRRVGIEVLR